VPRLRIRELRMMVAATLVSRLAFVALLAIALISGLAFVALLAGRGAGGDALFQFLDPQIEFDLIHDAVPPIQIDVILCDAPNASYIRTHIITFGRAKTRLLSGELAVYLVGCTT